MRRELLAHCYRMLGSVHDAEDLVQETYLRAWRGYDGFEGRSSLRTWLYRIATTAVPDRARQPGPPAAADRARRAGVRADGAAGRAGRGAVAGADARRDGRRRGRRPGRDRHLPRSIRLALIAALQHLPPRQRAVLILRDVLKWRAAEVAEVLDTTTVAVNSILQRARAQLDAGGAQPRRPAEPLTPEQRDQLDRYVKAFESYDVRAIADAVHHRTRSGRCRRSTAGTRAPEAIGRAHRDPLPGARSRRSAAGAHPRPTASPRSACICAR